MRIDRKIFLPIAVIAFAVDYAYLVLRVAVGGAHADISGAIHTVLVLVGFGAWALTFAARMQRADTNPVQLMARMVILAAALLLATGLNQMSFPLAEAGGLVLPPHGITAAASFLLALLHCAAAIVVFTAIAELIFVKRRRHSRRNFAALLAVLGLAMAIAAVRPSALAGGTTLRVLFLFVLVALMTVNAFRFAWIVVLTRREKLVNLLLAFFGFVFFVILSAESSILDAFGAQGGSIHRILYDFHPLAAAFGSATYLFGAIYMGVGFVSTLLHLPTAKEFDRKKAEVSSLRNLSRLVTQVFDVDELASTAAHLAMDVAEADCAWIAVRSDARRAPGDGDDSGARYEIRALRNVAEEDLARLACADGRPFHALVHETGKPVIVYDVASDRRLRRADAAPFGYASVIVAPLMVHDGPIGMLGIAKKRPYEFDKDAIGVLYAFADMAAVAFENSRLIARSIARERLAQEIAVAQQMQRSLLPALLPIAPTYDIAAVSMPAYEVGGDYYDALRLDENHVGLTIGDVSGKGVSAALYMAQVKGIFQSLGWNMRSPRDMLVRMNDTLAGNLERRSFISLLAAVLDTTTGEWVFARAGHCPLLYISRGESRYLRPNGMGLGLDRGGRFAAAIEEERLQLREGDVIVLYTDGVTEAKNAAGEEYHFERLADCVIRAAGAPSEAITRDIIQSVHTHTGSTEHEDDITVLVLRWTGTHWDPGAPPPAGGTEP